MNCVFVCVCSEEEINNMKMELDKYGIQMPAFNKIGGILANELSVDEAAGRERWRGGGGEEEREVEMETVICSLFSHQSMRR